MRHDLTSLSLFIAVAECANLTKAAEREHLAVSAVSKRMAELEDRLGVKLLERYARGVGLTPAGQSLLHHARQLVRQVGQLDADLAEFAHGIRGHVKMQAVASALTQHLPADLQSFLSRYPGVGLSLEEQTGPAVVQAVLEGRAELGVVSAGNALRGLVALPYHGDRLMLGVPAGHALARRRQVRFEEVLDHDLIGPHPQSSLAALMSEGARAAGRPWQPRLQVSSFDAMCRLVQTGLGLTVLPSAVLAPHAGQGRLRAIALDEDWAWRPLWVVLRDAAQLGPIASSLAAHLQRAAEVAA